MSAEEAGSRRSGRARAPVSYNDDADDDALFEDDVAVAVAAPKPDAEKRRIAGELAQSEPPKGPASSDITDPDAKQDTNLKNAGDDDDDAENSSPANAMRQPAAQEKVANKSTHQHQQRRVSGSQGILAFAQKGVSNCGDAVVSPPAAGAGAEAAPSSKRKSAAPAAGAAKKGTGRPRGRPRKNKALLSDDEADDEMELEDAAANEEKEKEEEEDDDEEEEEEDEVTRLTKNILAEKDGKSGGKKTLKKKMKRKNAFAAFAFNNKKKTCDDDADDDEEDDDSGGSIPKGFVHYAGSVYCHAVPRSGPPPQVIDLTFQQFIDGEHVPFANCDATGRYAPGKDVPHLRSKVAVSRYLERGGMKEEELQLLAEEFAAAKRAASDAAAAEAAERIAARAERQRASSRAAAPRRTLKDVSSDDDSDLLESDEERSGGGGDATEEEEEMEPLEKIEKIIYCADAADVSAEDIEMFASDDAKEVYQTARAKAASGAAKNGKRPPLLYCVKWEGCSYRRRSWETESGVAAFAPPKLAAFKRRHAANPDLTTEPFHPNFLVIDRVIDSREAGVDEEEEEEEEEENGDDDEKGEKEAKKESDPMQYLVKWRGLGYSDATWESGEDLNSTEDAAEIALYERRNDIKAKRAVHAAVAERMKNGTKPAAKPVPPPFKNGMSLREYQVTSFEWMVGNYRRRKNVILGDEMGLGKTAQCISVMEHVRVDQLRTPRPFLVIAPLTTLGHWKREMEKWTGMNVVLLDGNVEDRRVCEETEFYFESFRGPATSSRRGPAKFDVLLVSFETARRFTDLVASFDWALCVVDEAHKLKDANSQTTQAVMEIPYEWLLLLTGTPIQNNVRELFGMMHVLDPEEYPSWEDFQTTFCDGGNKEVDAEQVMRLREVLRPRMLRRMKEDVETIPAKEEIVVWVELTPEQRAYYRMIYEKQVHVLMEGNKSKNVPKLRNMCMELRKVCNHPFLCDGLEQDYSDKRMRAVEVAAAKAAAEAVAAAEAAGLPAPSDPPPAAAAPTPLDLLTNSSGKMVLVSKLLPKLKKDGHKVLIFSQFTIVLDILEDYLSMMKYEFERLDGNTSQADRQAGIDRFNSPDQGFVYLLSTRAGGMGITLTAADTAIIYDSDWNPQNDLQAMARCHRIGQTKEVKVYRLVTKATYEQSLFETSAKKYGLDEAVLGGGDALVSGGGGGSAKQDAKKINELLKYGVHGALRDASGEEAAAFAEEDIDQILSGRAEHRAIGSRAGNTFSVATFSVGGAEAGEGGTTTDAEKFWEELLPDAVKAAREEATNVDPFEIDERFRVEGPRKRYKAGEYKEGANGMGMSNSRRRRGVGGDDDDFDADEEKAKGGSGSSGGRAAAAAARMKAQEAKRAAAEAAKAARASAWRDAECKALEDALYSFGVGAFGDCRRACLKSGVARPYSEVSAAAATLVDMIERVGKVCKVRFDELEKAAAEAGPVERCKVCASQKKGRCGTETAPRSCLKLPSHLADAKDDAEDGSGAVPIGMDRATWEATIKACEATLEDHKDTCPSGAASSLARMNTWKRLASGWQRATKCLKERAALATAIEAVGDDVDAEMKEEKEDDDVEKEEEEEEVAPPLPAEKETFACPQMMRGAMASWWNQQADADLLRGSLRHGFSPWSQEALQAQFEAIRTDRTLSFYGNTLPADAAAPAGEDKGEATDEKERASEIAAAAAASDVKVMPGRDALKRRLLRLLDLLINPPPVRARKPTKAEIIAEQRKKAAEERIARDRERMKRDRERFEASLQGRKEHEPAAIAPSLAAVPAAAAAAAAKEDASGPAEGKTLSTTTPNAAKRARTSVEGNSAADPGDAAAATTTTTTTATSNQPLHVSGPFALAAAAAAAAKTPGVLPAKTSTKMKTLTDDQDPLTSLVIPAVTGVSVAASVALTPAPVPAPSAAPTEAAVDPTQTPATTAAPSSAAPAPPAPPAAPVAPAAPVPSSAFKTPSTASSKSGKENGGGFGFGVKSTGGKGGKSVGGKGIKASLAAAAANRNQASLFGFFSKTPAPSAASERPRTVATPTTGGGGGGGFA